MWVNMNIVIGLFFKGELFFEHIISHLQSGRDLLGLFIFLLAVLALMLKCPPPMAWVCGALIDFVSIVK